MRGVVVLDKEISHTDADCGTDGVDRAAGKAMQEHFISIIAHGETGVSVVMGGAADLPLLLTLPSATTALHDGCSTIPGGPREHPMRAGSRGDESRASTVVLACHYSGGHL